MEFFPAYGREDLSASYKPSTLVVPALSTGNVGQLAVDLLISSMGAKKLGFLDDPNVLPCIGNDPFTTSDKGELTLAVEVYKAWEHNLMIVQQRSPVIKGGMLKFARNFSHWASETDINEVIILSGVDAGKRHMNDVGSAQISYLSSANTDGTDPRCEKLGWRKFDYCSPSSNGWKLLESLSNEEENENHFHELPLNDEMYYPSLPFASLYCCCKAKGLDVLCILCFCFEGDNVQDAFFLGDAFRSLFSYGLAHGHTPSEWIVPESWKTVYGPPPDPSIF